MEQRDQRIAEYQAQQSAEVGEPVRDTTGLSRGLHAAAWISLVVILVLACITMFGSSDMEAYAVNLERFKLIGFLCTIVYFAAAYWALHREKALQKT